jgi:CBS domain-containing protein
MSAVEIPEPLATALRSVAAWMVLGEQGTLTASEGNSLDDYRDLLKEHKKLVMPFLRQEVRRHSSNRLTVREVDRNAIAMSSQMFRYFVTCHPDSPVDEVAQLSESGLVALYSIGVEPRFSRVGVVAIHITM